MLWLFMAVLVLVAGLAVMRRRRRYEAASDEPWRASLQRDDEPLDVQEIRQAEEEWLAGDSWQEPANDEDWRR